VTRKELAGNVLAKANIAKLIQGGSRTVDDFDDDVEMFADGSLWRTCWQCGGEGASHHDCVDDTCCCLYPIDNVHCDICQGEGGWNVTPTPRNPN